MNLIVTSAAGADRLSHTKFSHPEVTAEGLPRAHVALRELRTVWFNTGTLCNLTCANCYIESSPSNDRLVYLSAAEVAAYLQEISDNRLPVTEIGITGGEPFMNPDILTILESCLAAGMSVLVLTNAMRPMLQHAQGLLALRDKYADKLCVRVSVDHYQRQQHQQERGRGSWAPMLRGLRWLSANSFNLQVAGRMFGRESEQQLRAGFAELFATHDVGVDASSTAALVLFPEMDERRDVPEITTACWQQLEVDPHQMMCATARMVVKRRGDAQPRVVACTLLPYQQGFTYGTTLSASLQPVSLNHAHCARFCVLGGGSCSA